MAKRPPIIIIGMSRSGTRVFTKLLERLGLFVGPRKGSNPRKRAIEIKYEDLLGDPVRVLKTATDFCELSASGSEIELITHDLRRNRAYAYLRNAELAPFADNGSEWPKVLGC
jgi:hypothetical protein